jgi:hypothetical protein
MNYIGVLCRIQFFNAYIVDSLKIYIFRKDYKKSNVNFSNKIK